MSAQANADATLAHRIRAGDRPAFRKLYERYHRRLYGFALTFVKSGVLAEEAVQEVFLTVWERRANLQEGPSLQPYLFTICKNHVLNVLQRAGREEPLREVVLRSAPPAQTRTDEQAIYADYEAAARRAVESLPPRRREVFELCRRKGLTYREVARSLGISSGTVSDHMVKANRHLKRYLRRHADLALSVLLCAATAFLLLAASGWPLA